MPHEFDEFDTYSRLALEKTIDYLKKNKEPTTSHPDVNTFILTPKTMARIIKHGGNLRSSLNEGEYEMFLDVLKTLASMGDIPSIYKSGDYFFRATHESNGTTPYSIIVKRIYRVDGRGGLCLLKK